MPARRNVFPHRTLQLRQVQNKFEGITILLLPVKVSDLDAALIVAA
jgi:hypothetical protein